MKRFFSHLRLWLALVTMGVAMKAGGTVPLIPHPDTLAVRQPIYGFGASDCWTMASLGDWQLPWCEQLADWLFSLRTDSAGQPLGIGLSIWRFNIGAGSAAQGRASGIHRDTRTESFRQPDGTYDWTRQAPQRLFLRLARQRGVRSFTAFANSPNVAFTQNGCATNTGRDGTLNLRSDCYQAFAEDLCNVVEGLWLHDSIRITHLSPLNEPDGHWNWQGPKQEGTPATKQEVACVVRTLGQELHRRHLDTEIIAPESSDYRCLFRTHHTGPERGYQVQSYFCPDSIDTWLGDVPNYHGIVAAHSYWTNTPLAYLRACRDTVRTLMQHHGARLWQTELCIMQNDEELGGGGGFDFSMRTALYVARVIHHDLVFADAETWQWWRAAGGNYKDGLIRIWKGRETPPDGLALPARPAKLLWAMGHYSRFVRPGARRLDFHLTDPHALMLSLYRNADGTTVAVAINYSRQPVSLQLPDGMRWQPYLTTDSPADNLRPLATAEGETVIPARAMVTFVSL